MRSIRFFTGVAFILGMALIHNPPATADDVVKVGIDASYRPFAYVDEQGNLAGFEVELTKAACKEMKVTCDISNVPWDGIFAALEAKKIDMVGTTVTLTPDRLAKYDATIAIYHVGYGFIVPSDADISAGLNGLKGKPVGTITGTDPYYKFIKGMLGQDADIQGYQNPDAAILDLDAGRIDAFMSDNFQLQGQFVSTGKYKFVAPPNFDSQWTGDGRAWYFRKGTGELVDKVNTALKTLIKDGTVDSLGKKYLGTSLKSD